MLHLRRMCVFTIVPVLFGLADSLDLYPRNLQLLEEFGKLRGGRLKRAFIHKDGNLSARKNNDSCFHVHLLQLDGQDQRAIWCLLFL
jgi:hypothetical protein